MAVVDDVLGAGSERLSAFREKIEGDRETMAPRFTAFKSAIDGETSRRSWFVSAGAVPLGLGLLAFAATAVILLWVGISGWRPVYPRWRDVVVVALGACAIVNAALLLAGLSQRRLWRRRSPAAETEAERWDAFRHYLTDFPRLQDAAPATLELWERYLVYGIAFGIADRVLQAAHLAMPAEFHDASSIYWISPNVVELGWHREMRGLEHAVGDPERDSVDEIALPQLERRRRRVLQAREVSQVVAERVPALGLRLGVGRTAAPQAALRQAHK